ncbi:MAG: virulence RhuM family protein, partial [Kiritimatiellae bacterium]|nr:virulence RhuM family protein [Kiritimatiellia bacterium]
MNLDVTVSLGYRINSKLGIQFRRWATRVLKSCLLQGYAIIILDIDNRCIIIFMRLPKNRRPINLKSLPRAKREVFRRQAFAAFKAGKKAYSVAKGLNLNESCVDNWYARFR